jgi:predicted MPP superfamily phosphohydrolase
MIPAAIGGAAAAGLPLKIDISEYEIRSAKITDPVRAVILSDLHNDSYGRGMRRLTAAVNQLNPDLILMPGDMCEENHHQDRTLEFLRSMKGVPMFFSTGNHEEFRSDLPYLLEQIRAAGVVIPENHPTVFRHGRTEIELMGIPCYRREDSYDAAEISACFRTHDFRILLSHRPSWLTLYSAIDCDLIAAGHAHGGQWRIPGTQQGLFAPQQGILPQLTGGMHDLGRSQMIISRGLVKHYHGIPRLYNNPEICVVNLRPKEVL